MKKKEKEQLRQQFGLIASYSDKNSKYFSNSACLFRLGQTGQNMSNSPSPPLSEQS